MFYRQGNPAHAVLQKGLRRGDLFLLLFMTPFNLLVLIGWDQAARARRQRQSVRSFIVKGRTHVSLAVTGTLGATLHGMMLASFAAAVAAFPSGFESSWRLLGGCWAAVGLTGVATALWYGAKLHAGEFDLILDERKERLSVPAMFDLSERLELKMGQLLSVTIAEHIEKDPEGKPVSRWRPTLTFTTGPGESASVPLAHYVDSHRAEVLVFWLRRRLRLDRGEQPVSATQAA
ncbi:hypothetical protein ACN28I_37805 [Archangium gephyra]|uniref:hypothetical protein n=1 Tax=Archangium gephyra TaxID=48 RepID=UPI003B792659